MGAIGQDHRIVEGSASPGSAVTDDIVPTPPSPCLNEIGDDDATPRQQWSPVHKLVRARTQPSADYGSVSAGLRSSGDEHCKREMIGRTCSAGERPTHKRNASHTQGCHARPDSPVMHVDIDCLDLSGLALRDESSQTGVGQVEPLTTGSVGYHSVAFGRPRSLGGRPSRSPALFVAPGHIGTGPSSPPSSYSTHSESGFGSPARRLASPAPTREVGRVRKGHWKKGKAIGVGSCGNVYLGMNEDTGELMAVKEITLEAKEKLLCSLYNEIQVMHKLVHPHIVGYLGAELQDSQRKLCIFQEWVPAGSLHSLLDQFGALSEAMTRKYTGQVLEGLTYLHANRVIHRDVKSKNILVDDRGNVKLADFGCALVLKDDNNGDGVEMSMKGTPLFMAPEMLLKRKCGRRVDVWSLGCAVLEMVTTRPPWAETFKHPIEIIEHFNKNPGPPPLPADLPIMLRRFLLLCFTWDPEMRPSAQELIAHPYLQQRSSAGDVDATNPSDDVPLEEMDRVSAVTRMRRCSSATLDLLAVQARQASIGVGIGGGIGAYGSGHSGSCRPPSPRYATGALANKRTPTRRRKFGVSEGTTAPLVPTEGIVPALGKVPRGQSDSSVTAAAPPGVSAAPTPGSVSSADDRPRRNSLPLTRSPPLSPEKPGEGERPRTNESRRPGRGAGVSGHFGQSEDEGRISGPILPRRLRGHVGDRSSSAGSSSIRSFVSNESVMVEAGSAALPDSSAVGTLGPASGGFRRIPTPLSTPREHEAPGDGDNRALVQGSAGVGAPVIPATTVSIPTPLSTPREHELLGVTLVGGCGTIVDLGPVSDTPPPTVRPLEIRPSVRVLDASWVPAPGGSADKVLPESRSGLKVMWGPAAPEADARGDMGPCH